MNEKVWGKAFDKVHRAKAVTIGIRARLNPPGAVPGGKGRSGRSRKKKKRFQKDFFRTFF